MRRTRAESSNCSSGSIHPDRRPPGLVHSRLARSSRGRSPRHLRVSRYGGRAPVPLRRRRHGHRAAPRDAARGACEAHDGLGVLVVQRADGRRLRVRRGVRGLAASGRITLWQTVTREVGAHWDGAKGRVALHHLRSMLHDQPTLCFLCGPHGLVREAGVLLAEAGVSPDRVRRRGLGRVSPASAGHRLLDVAGGRDGLSA